MKMVKFFSNYSKKLITLLLSVSLVPMLIVSSYVYFDKINNETDSLTKRLVSVSEIGSNNVEKWLEERKNNVHDIAKNQLVIAEVKNIIDSTAGEDELFAAKFSLAKQLSTSLHSYDWFQEFIISNPKTGETIYHTDVISPSTKISMSKHFDDALQGNLGVSDVFLSSTFVKNEYGNYEQKVPTLLISAPIVGEVGQEGILTARMDFFKIAPAVKPYIDDFASADTYLIDSEGYFLSKSAFTQQLLDLKLIERRPELELQAIDPVSKEFTEIVQMANKNTTIWNMDGYNNYLGNSVVGSITPVKGTNWYYIAEVAKDEAYHGITLLRNTLWLSIGILLSAIIVVSFLFARALVTPIKKLTKVAEIIGTGTYDVSIETQIKAPRDEVGTLAYAFDGMRMKIIEHMKALEDINQELWQERTKFERLYDDSPDLYRTIDVNGIILDCNKSYAEHLGYSKDEIIGKSIFEHTAENNKDAMAQSFESWKKTGLVLNREVWLKRKDGSTFPTLISASNLYDDNGKLIGSNTIIKNISEVHQLRELDKAKEEFTSMIAHELKTPIVPIQGYCELFLDGTLGELTKEQREKIKIMHDSALTLSQLIQDVLDVHKLELAKLNINVCETSVKGLIDSAIKRFMPVVQSKKINLVDDTKQNIKLSCDAERIIQVINNLISNAIKFVPEQKGRIEIGARRANGSIVFVVKDNGIGIPVEKQDGLFRKFYQVDASLRRSSGGSGLGLAICKGIVEAHKGKIWLESEEGKGATFFFSIPVRGEN
jgi:PAS domain S-box-containing protein